MLEVALVLEKVKALVLAKVKALAWVLVRGKAGASEEPLAWVSGGESS
jgi:hypothetical protein